MKENEERVGQFGVCLTGRTEDLGLAGYQLNKSGDLGQTIPPHSVLQSIGRSQRNEHL